MTVAHSGKFFLQPVFAVNQVLLQPVLGACLPNVTGSVQSC